MNLPKTNHAPFCPADQHTVHLAFGIGRRDNGGVPSGPSARQNGGGFNRIQVATLMPVPGCPLPFAWGKKRPLGLEGWGGAGSFRLPLNLLDCLWRGISLGWVFLFVW